MPALPFRLLVVYLARGALLWAMVRIVAAAGIVLMRATISADAETGVLAPLLVTAALCAVDFYRRREATFVANLGIAPVAVVVVSVLPALAGEAILLLVHGR